MSSKLDATAVVADPFIRLSNLRFDGIFEIQLIFKESIPLPRGRNCTYACVGHTCNVHSHAECLRRHLISECFASIPDRRRRPGSALSCYGPPVGPSPPPALSTSMMLDPDSSEQLTSIAPRWPHSKSLGPGCTTTWPAVRPSVNLQVHTCSYGISDLYMHVLCMYLQTQYRHICICTEMHILFICLYVYVWFIYVCISSIIMLGYDVEIVFSPLASKISTSYPNIC